MGTADHTADGVSCQSWDTQTPHSHSLTDAAFFQDETISDAGSFCRNPDGEPGGPWCYTVDDTIRWAYCAVDLCCKSTGLECCSLICELRITLLVP